MDTRLIILLVVDIIVLGFYIYIWFFAEKSKIFFGWYEEKRNEKTEIFFKKAYQIYKITYTIGLIAILFVQFIVLYLECIRIIKEKENLFVHTSFILSITYLIASVLSKKQLNKLDKIKNQ